MESCSSLLLYSDFQLIVQMSVCHFTGAIYFYTSNKSSF